MMAFSYARLGARSLLLFAVALTGCSGGQFKVERPLRETKPLGVQGALGFNAYECSSEAEREKTGARPHGLAADEEASLRVGSWVGVASAPHRELSVQKLFGEEAVEKFVRFTGRLDPILEVASSAQAAAHAPRFAPAKVATQVNDLLQGIEFVLSLPGRVEETMSFSLVADNEGRLITAMCSSTDWTRVFGFFDSMKFSLACRIVSSADDLPRDLRVTARGTWANASFEGALASPRETARFASQNVVVMGTGGVRGFDLRSPAGEQLAAVSFWHVPKTPRGAEPRAWLAPTSSPGWSDAMLTSLAIAYLYPWPSACDAQRLRKDSMDQLDERLKR